MKVKINHNNYDLWCCYFKEKIDVGEKYIEVIEEYLDEEILKTYKYDCMDTLVEEYLDNFDKEPEIEEL